MAPPADAVLAFGSGFPLIILGGLLLAIRPWRPQQVFFALFAMLWGLQVVATNWARVFVDPDLHARLLLVGHVFMMVATLFLVHFATRLRPHRLDWVPTALVGLVSGAAFVTYIHDPGLIVEYSTQSGNQISTTYGPLIGPLVQVPFFAAFLLAIILLHREYRRARPGTTRHRLRGVIMALTLFASYQYVRNGVSFFGREGGFAQFASGAVRSSSDVSTLIVTGAFMIEVVVLAAIAIYTYLRPPPPEGHDLPMAMVFIFPAGTALAEHVLYTLDILKTLDTVGFWRLLCVGVLVYTLANYQLFDLDVKLKRFAAPGLAGLLGLFGVPLVLALAQGDYGIQATIVTLLPNVIGVIAVMVFQTKVQDRLFAGVQANPDYTHQRRLELYKVALEDAVQRGHGVDDPGLASIRARYGISDDEHKVLVWVVGTPAAAAKTPQANELGPGSVVVGRYRIDRLLGQGTGRATYLATDMASRDLVAIKAVRPDALDGAAARLLLREARLVATIEHPNILSIFDVAEESGHALIIMDYADEGNVADFLDRNGPMAMREAVRFLSELLFGLDELHRRGIIHRNLKPKNVLLDADGTVLIADLSAARSGGTADRTDELASTALLDQLYQSPEQMRGLAALAGSDLYVAAVLFHQVLTQRYYLPIAGRSDAAIRDLILDHVPTLDLHGQPAWVEAFLLKALAKAPADRFPDARAMRDALHQAAGIRPRGV